MAVNKIPNIASFKTGALPLDTGTPLFVLGIGIVFAYGGSNGTTIIVTHASHGTDVTENISVSAGENARILIARGDYVSYTGGRYSTANYYIVE